MDACSSVLLANVGWLSGSADTGLRSVRETFSAGADASCVACFDSDAQTVLRRFTIFFVNFGSWAGGSAKNRLKSSTASTVSVIKTGEKKTNFFVSCTALKKIIFLLNFICLPGIDGKQTFFGWLLGFLLERSVGGLGGRPARRSIGCSSLLAVVAEFWRLCSRLMCTWIKSNFSLAFCCHFFADSIKIFACKSISFFASVINFFKSSCHFCGNFFFTSIHSWTSITNSAIFYLVSVVWTGWSSIIEHNSSLGRRRSGGSPLIHRYFDTPFIGLWNKHFGHDLCLLSVADEKKGDSRICGRRQRR